jgi:hypothetical protein
MAGRRVVVDMKVREPAPADRCPGCNALFDGPSKRDLRQVELQWRCLPGKHPRTFELRCRSCSRLAIVYETTTGYLAFVSDQAASLRAIRDITRENTVPPTRSRSRDRER